MGRLSRSVTSAQSTESSGEMRKALEKYNEALLINRAEDERRGKPHAQQHRRRLSVIRGKQKALEKYNEALSSLGR